MAGKPGSTENTPAPELAKSEKPGEVAAGTKTRAITYKHPRRKGK